MANSRSLRFTVNATTTHLAATNATRTGATLTLHNHNRQLVVQTDRPPARALCTTPHVDPRRRRR